MTDAKVVHDFAISAEQLWELIGDFGDVEKWSTSGGSCEQEGEGIGSIRTLTMDDGRIIVDRLDDFGDQFYRYSIVESPLPFKEYQATMRVTSDGEDSCQLTWSSEFEPKGMSDAEAIAYIEGVYRWGISMMVESIHKNSQ